MTVRQGNARSVMTSYNKLNGVYTANSWDLCTLVLRHEWGFDGVVMTDWYSTNPRQADNAVAIAVGNDLIMPGGTYSRVRVLRGLKNGKLTNEQLRRCCGNVVKAVFASPTQREYIDCE